MMQATASLSLRPFTTCFPVRFRFFTTSQSLTNGESPLTREITRAPGSGEFNATIREDGTAINYELTYRDLSSPVTQAHIHFGRPAISGGIVLFLCMNLTPPGGVPTPQACPNAPATITGTLTAADVIPLPDQGIDPGAAGFAEMIEAIRAGAAYANVHTTVHPGGEIRGRLRVHEDVLGYLCTWTGSAWKCGLISHRYHGHKNK